MESGVTISEVLEDKGFEGLWRSCSINSMEDAEEDCFGLTDKLIEVSKLYLNKIRILS